MGFFNMAYCVSKYGILRFEIWHIQFHIQVRVWLCLWCAQTIIWSSLYGILELLWPAGPSRQTSFVISSAFLEALLPYSHAIYRCELDLDTVR